MVELTLEITSKCQTYCPYCSSNAFENGKDMEFEKIRRIIIHEKFDIIRLSGGEPTLHSRFDEIVSFIRRERPNCKLILLTNGLNIVREKFRDYFDEVIIHWIPNRNSIFEINILYYKKMFKKVSLHVVNYFPFPYLEKLIEALTFAKKYNIPIRILALQKQGRAKNDKGESLFSFTGDKGCNKNNKMTITPSGKKVSCTALKEKSECNLC
jgi:organic radical activating enzyme